MQASIWLNEKTKDWLEEYADDVGLSQSEVARHAIQHYRDCSQSAANMNGDGDGGDGE